MNSSGGTIFSSNYKPYGTAFDMSGSQPIMFTGRTYDSSTGLYYNSRFYNPAIQRFISEDHGAGAVSSHPKSIEHNLYEYANDNPLRFGDPTGHQPANPGAWENYFRYAWYPANEATFWLAIASTILAAIGVGYG